ncbi:hypothetical protein RZS28_05075 [Methylocapsa polymorpha]|uniref:Uncharacterized protein n=1 Tax=Methylocapsa polymorpha TaxID=3080828 RepID=A0ABZ0HV55_9HYPH|nr:hypothetical protein RZS28_05075 [Methylocapsa sp. RX1]
MGRWIFLFAAKAWRRRDRQSARACSAPSARTAHLAALLRGLAFMAATLLLILPMAVAGRCGQPARDVEKAAIEPASRQGRLSNGGFNCAAELR